MYERIPNGVIRAGQKRKMRLANAVPAVVLGLIKHGIGIVNNVFRVAGAVTAGNADADREMELDTGIGKNLLLKTFTEPVGSRCPPARSQSGRRSANSSPPYRKA
jgi:hypothetical protein